MYPTKPDQAYYPPTAPSDTDPYYPTGAPSTGVPVIVPPGTFQAASPAAALASPSAKSQRSSTEDLPDGIKTWKGRRGMVVE
ncbi:hypothetical protein Cni_G04877 [Canna indica]|uniref:Uncharacterized protein n=1 Tax=Canna indica TaxID=4628 RepID=A0AAQ3JXZ9_9LILI|nr:hypothetical protein Cni_G04877 [Canna indica]